MILRPTTEYGEPSSDDLSSEWESSNEISANQNSEFVTLKEPLATTLALNAVRRRKMIPNNNNNNIIEKVNNNDKKEEEEETDEEEKKEPKPNMSKNNKRVREKYFFMYLDFLHFSLDYLPRIRDKVTLWKLNPTAFNEVLMSFVLKIDAH